MNTARILTQAQAVAVYSAMCALNNVDIVFGEVRIAADRAQHDIRVQWGEDGVTVGQGLRVAIERYADQAAFVAAYGLETKDKLRAALEIIAAGNTDPDGMVELAKNAIAD